ncbi:hypothetical protein, partial [Chlorobaculum thiosulfatiphilum]|uniref:hypothetical protein n=1 Tax=Chlorobaculum thiosulfatiphilum TaxID=115852 RepID=UPI001B879002
FAGQYRLVSMSLVRRIFQIALFRDALKKIQLLAIRCQKNRVSLHSCIIYPPHCQKRRLPCLTT